MTKKDFLDKYRRDDIAPSTGKCIFKVFKEQMMELEKRNKKNHNALWTSILLRSQMLRPFYWTEA